MNRTASLFTGIFGAFAISTFAIVMVPQTQLGPLNQFSVEDEGKITDVYPVNNDGIAQQGRQIYIGEGCITCHTQQLRDPQLGLDLERGWGPRRTVARDYIFESPALLGSSRMGPDLSNAGTKEWRNEAKDAVLRRPAKRDATWHLLHLYHPTAIIAESSHPPYRYLFEVRKIVGQGSTDALKIPMKDAPERGYEIVPSAAAKSLVGYLLSLDRTHELAEAKAPSAANNPAAPASAPAQ